MHLALNNIKQTERRCEPCSESFHEITGAIFGDGQPLGFFMIALHGHSPEGRLAHLAMAVCSLAGDAASAALAVSAGTEGVVYRFLDWHDSPWNSQDLDNMLDRDAVLQSPFRPTFLHAAEHVVRDIPEVSGYFSDERQS
jgi:hypothetical protein